MQYLKNNADKIANNILSIAIWNKNNIKKASKSKNIIKLPPFFHSDTHSKKNIIAMIYTICDYVESDHVTLKNLHHRFNKYVGEKVLDINDVRKLHNWMHQLNFAIRASVLLSEIEKNDNIKIACQNTYDYLYKNENTKFPFVIKDNNTYKPLRYASKNTILEWIEKESQLLQENRFNLNISEYEKEIYGIKKHDDFFNNIKKYLNSLVKNAQNNDDSDDFLSADIYDNQLQQIHSNLKG